MELYLDSANLQEIEEEGEGEGEGEEGQFSEVDPAAALMSLAAMN